MNIGDILIWLDSQNYEYEFSGDESAPVEGFSSLSRYKADTISWVKDEQYYTKLGRPTDITCAVVQDRVSVDFKNIIRTKKSKELFFAILRNYWGSSSETGHIGKGTVISEEAIIAPSVSIGCNCTIVGNVQISAYTVIENNVVIQGNVRIGRKCHIQSGAVIGIDGYGYSLNTETGKKEMVMHFGGVEIGDEVFIGSHVNIARGTIDDTVIKSGVKIAPSTHIGHNNVIEENTSLICSNLYGSVQVGQDSYITASTIENQVKIGNHTVIGMGSVVTKPIEDNVIAFGIPAKVIRKNDSSL